MRGQRVQGSSEAHPRIEGKAFAVSSEDARGVAPHRVLHGWRVGPPRFHCPGEQLSFGWVITRGRSGIAAGEIP